MVEYISTDVLEDSVGNGRTVFVPATDTAVVLNPTAARIWDLAREGVPEALIPQRLAAECGVTDEVVAPHVASTLDQLVRQGLLVVAETA